MNKLLQAYATAPEHKLPALKARIIAYANKHPLWSCLASVDEMAMYDAIALAD